MPKSQGSVDSTDISLPICPPRFSRIKKGGSTARSCRQLYATEHHCCCTKGRRRHKAYRSIIGELQDPIISFWMLELLPPHKLSLSEIGRSTWRRISIALLNLVFERTRAGEIMPKKRVTKISHQQKAHQNNRIPLAIHPTAVHRPRSKRR